MAYEKTTWATGDIITAEKLNHAEDGIAAADTAAAAAGTASIMVLAKTAVDTLGKSYNELAADIEAGKIPVLKFTDENEIVNYYDLNILGVNDQQQYVACFGGSMVIYTANSADAVFSLD